MTAVMIMVSENQDRHVLQTFFQILLDVPDQLFTHAAGTDKQFNAESGKSRMRDCPCAVFSESGDFHCFFHFNTFPGMLVWNICFINDALIHDA